MNQKFEDLNLREILFILRKHIAVILAMTIGFGAIGFLVSKFIIKPQYEADATLVVNASQNTQTSITYDQLNTAQQLVNTYAVILKSNTVLNQVIQDLDLQTDTKKLAKSITVGGAGQTEVINISVKNPDRKVAVKIANDIVKVAPDVIIRTVKAGSVEPIDYASASDKPVSPNISLYTVIAVCVGLILSILVAFVLEMMNNTFPSDQDVKDILGLTVLGVIPCYNVKNM